MAQWTMEVNTEQRIFSLILSFGGSLLAYLFGRLDGLVIALLTMMAMDFITKLRAISYQYGGGVSGFHKAVTARAISSRTAFNKTFNKLIRYTIVIVMGTLLSHMVPKSIVIYGISLSELIRYFIWANLGLIEFGSVLENLSRVNGKDLTPLRELLNPTSFFSFLQKNRPKQ
jgi:phage-related holin